MAPGLAMGISAEEFLQQVTESGLMSAEAVRAFRAALTPDKRDNAQKIARELVKQQKLTSYQATAIYQGRGKKLLLGNYIILDRLGQGGMGMVLKAQHRRMKRVVALKILSPAITKNADMVRRFQCEVEAAAKLEHPHVVTAYHADEASGTHFLVMQYIEGSDLASSYETVARCQSQWPSITSYRRLGVSSTRTAVGSFIGISNREISCLAVMESSKCSTWVWRASRPK